ncbi:MAG: hypothetical protein HYY55_03520 [Candidatus Niyogibacteria bacterium]|nr:MAG: hypothetical protein HYY55_03520 [Candidatus Niyogibacteria bacterium]
MAREGLVSFVDVLHRLAGISRNVVHEVIEPNLEAIRKQDERLKMILYSKTPLTQEEKEKIISILRGIENQIDNALLDVKCRFYAALGEAPSPESDIVLAARNHLKIKFWEALREISPCFYNTKREFLESRPLSPQ